MILYLSVFQQFNSMMSNHNNINFSEYFLQISNYDL